jgi:pyridoxal phosphate enzyme (YggS family)
MSSALDAQLTGLPARLAEVQARVQAAAWAAGRTATEVTLVAVSKGHPAAAVRAAYAAGQRDFGENYVQEWLPKRAELADLPDLRWHLLGHLQRNKVKLVMGQVHLFHAVDDMLGLDEMARVAHAQGVSQDVLLQVNLAAEDQKRGCGEDDAELFVDVLLRSPGLRLQGLMLLPPAEGDPQPWFERLRRLADELKQTTAGRPGAPARWLLSMGMSGDFEQAIAAGATHVRVGTAIFGERAGREVQPSERR